MRDLINQLADNAKQLQARTEGHALAHVEHVDGTLICPPEDLLVCKDGYDVRGEAWLSGTTVDVRGWR